MIKCNPEQISVTDIRTLPTAHQGSDLHGGNSNPGGNTKTQLRLSPFRPDLSWRELYSAAQRVHTL